MGIRANLVIAKNDNMIEIKNCLDCKSDDLAPINFSANECQECGFQQSIKLPERVYLDPRKLRGL